MILTLILLVLHAWHLRLRAMAQLVAAGNGQSQSGLARAKKLESRASMLPWGMCERKTTIDLDLYELLWAVKLGSSNTLR